MSKKHYLVVCNGDGTKPKINLDQLKILDEND
jgi:hypothetical protein